MYLIRMQDASSAGAKLRDGVLISDPMKTVYHDSYELFDNLPKGVTLANPGVLDVVEVLDEVEAQLFREQAAEDRHGAIAGKKAYREKVLAKMAKEKKALDLRNGAIAAEEPEPEPEPVGLVDVADVGLKLEELHGPGNEPRPAKKSKKKAKKRNR